MRLLQSAVRAALCGRVLVVEGVERAERNVLPVLNNLLENREMQLDDGRTIVAHQRYHALLQVRECILRASSPIRLLSFVFGTYTYNI